jgi:glycosyltransferase involved in cell wall biosynthesis
MRTLRLCFLTTFYPPFNFGGDGIGIQRLARALVARGHQVTVVHDRDAFRALHRGSDPPAVAEPEGLTVIGLETWLCKASLLLTHQFGRPVIHARRLRQIIGDGRFDALVFNNVSLIGGPGLLSFGRNLPKLYMAHEHWLVCQTHTLWRHNRELCSGRQCARCALHYRRPPQPWRWTGYLEKQVKNVDTFVAMSEFSRQKHREFGFEPEMKVLPYFIPTVPRKDGPTVQPEGGEPAPHSRPYFLIVGRLERLKGVDDVIAAFAQVDGADLLIAGEGQYGATLRAQAASNPHIVFLGRVDRPQLDRYYRHAVALIVPSQCYETFGVITLEAFQQHTPVIARRIGPLPEIVEGAGAGEAFETREELVMAMRRLQQDPARRAALGEAAFRAYESHYSERVIVPRFLQLVVAAIDGLSLAAASTAS